ncbi:STAS domain-containing protein [Streptomyces poriferorum]|uniref:STAS domain-containing protein n=1 Tax=Streptomyces poriferorum TaxID=2798799 RepID=UPI001C5D5D20|nr:MULTISPECIES: STAS domain-containing protein [Streptomyces]MBW5250617.1 STAS domain-containing protein [Streptomyces poriferorum]MBW5260924.1 STAS domain-containing protein [Streptomyces poriferorum]WLQ52859.1 STAS domain-containing protein [Streptomyces sp. Alt1]
MMGGLVHLKVSYEDQSDGIAVVRVESTSQGGSLDSASAPELREVLSRLVADGRLILVVDLSAIESVDYSGFAMLGGIFKRVHFEGGALLLAGPRKQARGMLSRVGLRGVLPVHATVSSAVEELAVSYAKGSVDDRGRRRRATANALVASGDHAYEHLSEDITLVKVMGGVPGGGELSVSNVAPLRKLMADLVSQGRCYLIMDLTHVDFIDSTGVGVFVGGLKRVRAFDGHVALVVSSEHIRKAFRITGLTRVFPMFETVDRAVEAVGRKAAGAYVRR